MPTFESTTLSSGLRVVAEIDGRGYSAAFGYFVRAGSRDESDAESGLSHFLEHMMFKGTERRSAADVNRELDELGGQSNAYTTEEHTVYYATVLPKYQDRLIDLLSDMLSPALRESDFETERQVILEEIAKYEDQPPFGAFERSLECYFGPRGLGRRVLGTAQSISEMPVQTMRDYFLRRYRPENMVLAASGNVDWDRLIAKAESLTQTWSQRPNVTPALSDHEKELPPGVSLERSVTTPDATQAYRVSVANGPAMLDTDRFAMRVLTTILGDDGGSRLFWDLIDTGRAEIATVWPQEFTDAGAIMTYLVCGPEDLRANTDWMNQVIARVATEGIQQEELDQTLNKITASCIMQSERPSGRLFSLGTYFLTANDIMDTDQVIAAYRAITRDDVARVARQYLSDPAGHLDVLATGDGRLNPAAA
ncbi:MAG: pitrilysin family protein [Planctomycetota bacterium]